VCSSREKILLNSCKYSSCIIETSIETSVLNCFAQVFCSYIAAAAQIGNWKLTQRHSDDGNEMKFNQRENSSEDLMLFSKSFS
jgi:hypothetical protein